MNDRDRERIINNRAVCDKADILFLKFSSDIGTIRNGGRRGSLFAPEAILSIVKKLACHNLLKWSDVELADAPAEKTNFAEAQQALAQRIEKVLSTERTQKFICLGGGHDYAYPWVKAINASFKKIVVINLDAHLDTRTDSEPNSGTPFRQLASEFDGELEIVQLGIHDFANSISTMSNLPKSTVEIVATYEDVRFGTRDFSATDKFLKKVIPYREDTQYVFSLDADVLDAGIMEGVSAVNHRGLPYDFVEDVLLYAIDELKCNQFGIFEYNPVYDNLSQKGARTLASLIYQIMDDRNFIE